MFDIRVHEGSIADNGVPTVLRKSRRLNPENQTVDIRGIRRHARTTVTLTCGSSPWGGRRRPRAG